MTDTPTKRQQLRRLDPARALQREIERQDARLAGLARKLDAALDRELAARDGANIIRAAIREAEDAKKRVRLALGAYAGASVLPLGELAGEDDEEGYGEPLRDDDGD